MPDNPSGQLSGSSGIGALRWLVTLYRRDQRPGAESAITDRDFTIATIVAPSAMKSSEGDTTVDSGEAAAAEDGEEA